ncbi:hypothetical protein CHS0354_017302 [Potamilus streckersoni]|uniref:SCO-spondin n=1 Tax=Potamilus streckersoni TaxID=2493646 RepID=A0AAE0W7S8_9BIVA|nr:hypothetical protein CHS0354_017302 [Potamilus streckersoni]
MGGPTAPFLGLLLWILTLQTLPRKGNAQADDTHICTVTKTTNIEVTKKCSEFLSMMLQGMQLNPVKSGIGQLTSDELQRKIDYWNKYPNSSPDCVYSQTVEKKVQECCTGWQGIACDQPVCNPTCQHGICVAPGKCSCKEGYGGFRCNEDESAVVSTSSQKYCYKNTECYGLQPDQFQGTPVLQQDCCIEGGGSWGGGSSNCTVCETKPGTGSKVTMDVRSPYRTCMNYGPSYFSTFDGLQYRFNGKCQYNMVSAINGDWSIQMQVKNCDKYSTCKKRLIFRFGGKTFELEGGTLYVDGEPQFPLLAEPKSGDGNAYTFYKLGDYVMLVFLGGTLRVKADAQSTVMITLQKNSVHKVKGLCGTNNDNPLDDMVHYVTGEVVNEVVFGNSHAVANGETVCPNAGSIPDRCGTQDQRNLAELACDTLISLEFRECHSVVDPFLWYQMCINDYCASTTPDGRDAVQCGTLDGYSRRCSLNAIQIYWRSPFLCPPIQCPSGTVYQEHMSSCPFTCSNLYTIQQGHCVQQLISGCNCPNGYYIQNGLCMKPEECLCFKNNNPYKNGDTIKDQCNECTCKMGQWDCTHYKCSATCSVYGFGHVTTFDGASYSFSPGIKDCTFKLLTTGNTSSNDAVEVIMYTAACRDLQTEKCIAKVEVTIQGAVAVIGTDTFSINGKETSLPYTSNILYCKQVTSIFTQLQTFGLDIQFDRRNRVYIRADPVYAYKLRGLCGEFNYVSDNDLVTASGMPEPKVEFMVSSFASGICYSPVPYMDPREIQQLLRPRAEQVCAHLKDAEVFGNCMSLVNFEYFYELCVKDMCKVTQPNYLIPMCDITGTMAHECAAHGIIVNWPNHGSLSSDCAHMLTCVIQGTTYTEAASSCGSHCRDLELSDQNCEDMHIAGCSCSQGQYIDDYGACRDPQQCTCYDPHSRKTFNPGEKVVGDCNECTCSHAIWNCTEAVENCVTQVHCPRDGQVYKQDTCQMTCDTYNAEGVCNANDFTGCGCIKGLVLARDGSCIQPENCPCQYAGQYFMPGEYMDTECIRYQCENREWVTVLHKDCSAVCWTSGDKHFDTFDGKHYSFSGDCEYSLVESKDGTFRVTVENIPCGSTGAVCTKRVKISVNGNLITLVKGMDLKIGDLSIAGNSYVTRGLEISSSETMVRIVAEELGFALQYDTGTRVYVFLKSQWRNAVAGLCGNYDGNAQDDFTSKFGEQSNLQNFADSWRTSTDCPKIDDPDGSDPCSGNHAARKAWAKQQCQMITNVEGVFGPCIRLASDVKIQMFYSDCMYDACSCDSGGDCECLCTALANFAKYCSRLGQAIKWRSNALCAIQCENGLQYNPCGSPCPQNCRNVGQEPEPSCEATGCDEGCFCPQGYVHMEGGCHPADKCSCTYNGMEYPPGTSMMVNCQNCTCMNAAFECSGEKCGECAEGQFRCGDMECINGTLRCDGYPDCFDNSDEKNCECGENEFRCEYDGTCIPKVFKCDGTPDCTMAGDEKDCDLGCKEDEFHCTMHGQCIMPEFVCDSFRDCVDGSDEENCAQTASTTASTTEIPTSTTKQQCLQEGMDQSRLIPSSNIIVIGQPELSDEEKDRLRTDDGQSFVLQGPTEIEYTLVHPTESFVYVEQIQFVANNNVQMADIYYRKDETSDFTNIKYNADDYPDGVVALNADIHNLVIHFLGPVVPDTGMIADISIVGCFEGLPTPQPTTPSSLTTSPKTTTGTPCALEEGMDWQKYLPSSMIQVVGQEGLSDNEKDKLRVDDGIPFYVTSGTQIRYLLTPGVFIGKLVFVPNNNAAFVTITYRKIGSDDWTTLIENPSDAPDVPINENLEEIRVSFDVPQNANENMVADLSISGCYEETTISSKPYTTTRKGSTASTFTTPFATTQCSLQNGMDGNKLIQSDRILVINKDTQVLQDLSPEQKDLLRTDDDKPFLLSEPAVIVYRLAKLDKEPIYTEDVRFPPENNLKQAVVSFKSTDADTWQDISYVFDESTEPTVPIQKSIVVLKISYDVPIDAAKYMVGDVSILACFEEQIATTTSGKTFITTTSKGPTFPSTKPVGTTTGPVPSTECVLKNVMSRPSLLADDAIQVIPSLFQSDIDSLRFEEKGPLVVDSNTLEIRINFMEDTIVGMIGLALDNNVKDIEINYIDALTKGLTSEVFYQVENTIDLENILTNELTVLVRRNNPSQPMVFVLKVWACVEELTTPSVRTTVRLPATRPIVTSPGTLATTQAQPVCDEVMTLSKKDNSDLLYATSVPARDALESKFVGSPEEKTLIYVLKKEMKVVEILLVVESGVEKVVTIVGSSQVETRISEPTASSVLAINLPGAVGQTVEIIVYPLGSEDVVVSGVSINACVEEVTPTTVPAVTTTGVPTTTGPVPCDELMNVDKDENADLLKPTSDSAKEALSGTFTGPSEKITLLYNLPDNLKIVNVLVVAESGVEKVIVRAGSAKSEILVPDLGTPLTLTFSFAGDVADSIELIIYPRSGEEPKVSGVGLRACYEEVTTPSGTTPTELPTSGPTVTSPGTPLTTSAQPVCDEVMTLSKKDNSDLLYATSVPARDALESKFVGSPEEKTLIYVLKKEMKVVEIFLVVESGVEKVVTIVGSSQVETRISEPTASSVLAINLPGAVGQTVTITVYPLGSEDVVVSGVSINACVEEVTPTTLRAVTTTGVPTTTGPVPCDELMNVDKDENADLLKPTSDSAKEALSGTFTGPSEEITLLYNLPDNLKIVNVLVVAESGVEKVIVRAGSAESEIPVPDLGTPLTLTFSFAGVVANSIELIIYPRSGEDPQVSGVGIKACYEEAGTPSITTTSAVSSGPSATPSATYKLSTTPRTSTAKPPICDEIMTVSKDENNDLLIPASAEAMEAVEGIFKGSSQTHRLIYNLKEEMKLIDFSVLVLRSVEKIEVNVGGANTVLNSGNKPTPLPLTFHLKGLIADKVELIIYPKDGETPEVSNVHLKGCFEVKTTAQTVMTRRTTQPVSTHAICEGDMAEPIFILPNSVAGNNVNGDEVIEGELGQPLTVKITFRDTEKKSEILSISIELVNVETLETMVDGEIIPLEVSDGPISNTPNVPVAFVISLPENVKGFELVLTLQPLSNLIPKVLSIYIEACAEVQGTGTTIPISTAGPECTSIMYDDSSSVDVTLDGVPANSLLTPEGLFSIPPSQNQPSDKIVSISFRGEEVRLKYLHIDAVNALKVTFSLTGPFPYSTIMYNTALDVLIGFKLNMPSGYPVTGITISLEASSGETLTLSGLIVQVCAESGTISTGTVYGTPSPTVPVTIPETTTGHVTGAETGTPSITTPAACEEGAELNINQWNVGEFFTLQASDTIMNSEPIDAFKSETSPLNSGMQFLSSGANYLYLFFNEPLRAMSISFTVQNVEKVILEKIKDQESEAVMQQIDEPDKKTRLTVDLEGKVLTALNIVFPGVTQQPTLKVESIKGVEVIVCYKEKETSTTTITTFSTYEVTKLSTTTMPEFTRTSVTTTTMTPFTTMEVTKLSTTTMPEFTRTSVTTTTMAPFTATEVTEVSETTTSEMTTPSILSTSPASSTTPMVTIVSMIKV